MKLRVGLADDPQRVLDRLVEELATGQARNATANAYGQALAMVRLGRVESARDLLEGLVASHPDNPTFQAEFAASEYRTGNLDRALALYAEGLALYPDDRVLVRGRAAALNEAGRPGDTLRLIDAYGQLHAPDAEMYRLRADANVRLGRTLDSRADLAEHFYLSGRLERAMDQLRLAMREPDQDFYRRARIEARLEELERERKLRLLGR